MSTPADISIPRGLSDEEAQALTQFVKRVTWSAMRECAVDDDECYQIRAAIGRLRRGAAPRGSRLRSEMNADELG